MATETRAGTTNAEQLFEPGEIVTFSGERFEVESNYGECGRVWEYPRTGISIWPFYWTFEARSADAQENAAMTDTQAEALTLGAWRERVNALVTETFGVGRQEWRLVVPGAEPFGWVGAELRETERDRQRGWHVETRLAPLDFCGSLDAVRRVEERVLRDAEKRVPWLACLYAEVYRDDPTANGSQIFLAPAEARAVALLRWRGVDVPPRLDEE